MAQVQELNGTWTHQLLPEGQIAVLAGYTLERATCGLIKAATHKAVCYQLLLPEHLPCTLQLLSLADCTASPAQLTTCKPIIQEAVFNMSEVHAE